MKLFKMSAPGWTKDYDNEADLKSALYSHICNECRVGEKYEDFVVWEPVNENSTFGQLLSTSCGCEYDVEL